MGGELLINGKHVDDICVSFSLDFRGPMRIEELDLNNRTIKEIKDLCRKYLDEHFFNISNDKIIYEVEEVLLLLAYLRKYKDDDRVEIF